MKFTKKLIAGCVVALTLTTTSVAAFGATTYQTPGEAVESLTGKTSAQILEERQSGKTYGTIAKEAGKLEEFITAMNDLRKSTLEERVKAGKISQEQADAILNAAIERQVACDGSGFGSDGVGCAINRDTEWERGIGRGTERNTERSTGYGTRHGREHNNLGRGTHHGACMY